MNNSVSNDSIANGSAKWLRYSTKWVVLLSIAAAIMVLNVVMTAWLIDGGGHLSTEIYAGIMFACLGGLHAQAIVLGVWLAWGTEPIRHRAPVCFLLLYLVWLSWTWAALSAASLPPLEVVGMLAVVLGITFVMCALAAGTIRRHRPQWRIHSLAPSAASDNQFTLASIMLWMLLVGLALGAGRLALNVDGPSFRMGSQREWVILVAVCPLLGMYGAMVGIAATWLVLSPRMNRRGLILAFLACTLGPMMLGVSIVIFVGGPGLDWRFLGSLFCYTGGMFAATFLALVAARGLGYRFQERSPAAALASGDSAPNQQPPAC